MWLVFARMLLLLLIMDSTDLCKTLRCCSVIWDLSTSSLLLISPMYDWNWDVMCRIHWKSWEVAISPKLSHEHFVDVLWISRLPSVCSKENKLQNNISSTRTNTFSKNTLTSYRFSSYLEYLSFLLLAGRRRN